MNFKKIINALVLLLFVQLIQAQTLRIMVSDTITSEPLIGATIKAAGQGTTTDIEGQAVLSNLSIGTYTLLVSYIGYEPKSIGITIPATSVLRVSLVPSGENLDEVIVESTRSNSRAEDSPTKVEVLGLDDMNEENGIKPGNVASILGDYSGVQIQQTSLNSGNSGIRIQGLASRYTQLLRDGMPLYAGLAGDFGILQVQPLDLKQIELIKNPASTLFGGGAIAGVVNFISKSPGQKPERAFTLNQTTLNETNATAWLSGRNTRVGYTFFGAGTRQRAKDVDGDVFSDVANLRSITVHPRLFLYGKNKSQLSIGATLVADNRLGGDIIAVQNQPDAVHSFTEQNTTLRSIVDLQWRKPIQRNNAEWSAKAALGSFKRKQILPNRRFEGQQTDFFSEIAYRKTQNAHLRWVVGSNFSGNEFTPEPGDSIAFGPIKNAAAGVFGQAAWHRGHWDAEAGFRVDIRNQWGVFPLPSGAVLYHINEHLFLRAGFGLGYAVPNPLTLAANNSESDPRFILAPNPNTVRAERSVGGNMEWNYHRLFGDHFSLTFNQQFFYTRFANPVTTARNAAGFFSPINADAPLTTGGADNYLRMNIWGTEVYFGYTYVLAKQHWVTQQIYVPLTPRHRAATVIARDFGTHFRTGIEASWTGKQVREDGTRTQSYLFAAAMIGYKFGHFDLILNGENLLDFRQTSKERVVLGPLNNPIFVPLWAPVDGRAINLALIYRL